MDIKEIFEREIGTNHVDRKLSFFISEFLKDDKIKDYLFVEFERCPLIPSFTDYLNIIGKQYDIDSLQSEHYSNNYSRSNFTPYDVVVKKIRLEFEEQILNETLADSFRINDLHRAPLILQLKKIENLLDDLENHIFSKLEDDVNQSKVFAESFFYLIDKIDSEYIKQHLVDFIINHNENRNISIKSVIHSGYRPNEDETKWRALKRNFDMNFREITSDLFDKEAKVGDNNKMYSSLLGKHWGSVLYYLIIEKKFSSELKTNISKYRYMKNRFNISNSEDALKKFHNECKREIESCTIKVDYLTTILPFFEEYYSDLSEKIKSDIAFIRSEQEYIN